MGKKRIIKQTEEQLLREGEQVAERVAGRGGLGGARARAREGRIYIASSYNNTLISLTDEAGNVLAQVSAGSIGFKGTRKSTPFAASKVMETLAQIAQNKGITRVRVFIRGIGPGRDSALRTLANKPLELVAIADITPIPHNGPTPKKPRRV